MAYPQPTTQKAPVATKEDEPPFELGTWTQRQRRLMSDEVGSGSEEAAAATAVRALRTYTADDDTTPGSLITAGLRQQQEAREREAAAKVHGDDEIMGAAWRWRFARRWHAEQVRELDPSPPLSRRRTPSRPLQVRELDPEDLADDKEEEALQFLKVIHSYID